MRWLDGKIAIVTGAASGIGRASANFYAREGARLVIRSERGRPRLVETAGSISKNGGSAHIFAADTSQEENVKAFVHRAVASFGALDVLCANAE
jgi:meso-butanediol dehydrogenase / (S,S)-butanediol dehydrogenase / diacetyl reductase